MSILPRLLPVKLLGSAFGVAIVGIALPIDPARADIAINKSFTPISVSAHESSTLEINLFNTNFSPANNTSFTDNLPSGLVVATPTNLINTCGGAITATPGGSSISLTGGTIPAAASGLPGTCKVTLSVVTATANTYVNTIPANALTSSQGQNPLPASATLTVNPPAPVTGSKAFSPTNLHGNGAPTTMTITLNNSNPFTLTNAALTDPLPSGLRVAASPTASTTCGSGNVVAIAGSTSVSLTGATIPASGSCTVTVGLEASNPNAYQDANVTNTIPANNISNTQNVTNTSPISGSVRLQTGAQVVKAFSPNVITVGSSSVLSLTLNNFNSTAITPADLTDVMPAGLTVTGLVGNTCGGTATFISSEVRLTGGTIPAAPSGATPGSCQVQATVTSSSSGFFNNTITAGSFNGVSYPGTSAGLTANLVSVGKSFSPNTTVQGSNTTLTIVLNNAAATAATITSFTDNLTTLGAGFTVGPGPVTTTCGGTVNAVLNSTVITKTDGVIPANGSCQIVVPVNVGITASNGSRTNTIAANGLQTSVGNNATAATANLTVNRAISLSKAFSPTTVLVGGVSRLTITMTRGANAPALTGITVTDNLPAGHTVDATPNLSNSCGGSVSAAANATSITITGGSLPGGAAASSCQIAVNVKAPATAGSQTNTIPANSISTDQGATYNQAAQSTLTRTSSYLTLNKAFSPTSISFGDSSTLTILIANNNPSAINLTNVSLTDVFPTGMVIANPPTPTFTGTGCTSGTITATPGTAQVSLSGASITANRICTLSVRVTSTFAGNLTNELPVGIATSNQGVINTNNPFASLTLLGVGDLEVVSKSNGVSSVAPGESTVYTILIRNNGPHNVAGITITDAAPASMTINGWSCTSSAGSSCDVASGTGNISTKASVLSGGTLTFTVNATIAPNASGSITNTVQVGSPPTVTDPDGSNNTSSDTDTIALANNPNLLLVKRITAINTTTLTDLIDDPATTDDNHPNWSTSYLQGKIDGGTVRPNDVVEYTIYFLSSGNTPLTNVNVCDLVPANSTFIPNSFSSAPESGVVLAIGPAITNLTNVPDVDGGEYFVPGATPSATCSAANTNGAVVVNIVKSPTTLPNATAAGVPANSYGFIRFRTRVK